MCMCASVCVLLLAYICTVCSGICGILASLSQRVMCKWAGVGVRTDICRLVYLIIVTLLFIERCVVARYSAS